LRIARKPGLKRLEDLTINSFARNRVQTRLRVVTAHLAFGTLSEPLVSGAEGFGELGPTCASEKMR
jgi:hypothetical protein